MLYEARQGHKIQMVPSNKEFMFYGPCGGRFHLHLKNRIP
jgi:hypothetical protein